MAVVEEIGQQQQVPYYCTRHGGGVGHFYGGRWLVREVVVVVFELLLLAGSIKLHVGGEEKEWGKKKQC